MTQNQIQNRRQIEDARHNREQEGIGRSQVSATREGNIIRGVTGVANPLSRVLRHANDPS